MLNKIKKPAIYLIWNLYMWGIILVEGKIVNYAQSQIKRTGQMEWSYLGMLDQVGVWILVGLGISWLVSKKSISSTRDILLEICTILIPNALLVFVWSFNTNAASAYSIYGEFAICRGTYNWGGDSQIY